jgi:hypothetical protein
LILISKAKSLPQDYTALGRGQSGGKIATESATEHAMSIEDKQRLEQEAKENLKTNLENRNQAVPTAPGSEGMSREVAQRIKSILFNFVVKMPIICLAYNYLPGQEIRPQ